jgi:hypothetical protein
MKIQNKYTVPAISTFLSYGDKPPFPTFYLIINYLDQKGMISDPRIQTQGLSTASTLLGVLTTTL